MCIREVDTEVWGRAKLWWWLGTEEMAGGEAFSWSR